MIFFGALTDKDDSLNVLLVKVEIGWKMDKSILILLLFTVL
jgi:hypothetical protein